MVYLDNNSHQAAKNRKYLSSVGKYMRSLLSENPKLSHLCLIMVVGKERMYQFLNQKGLIVWGMILIIFQSFLEKDSISVSCGFVLNTQSSILGQRRCD